MPTTKDCVLKTFKCLLYGRTGIGKTTLLGTAPKPFIIATEDGLAPLFTHDLQYKLITKSSELKQLWLDLKNSPYETVCIDSLSALSDMMLAEIEQETGSDEARVTYPLLRSKLWKTVLGYLKLPKHVIFTATETRSDDKPVLPSVTGAKLCEDIGRPFDFVQFMDFGKDDNVVIYTSRHKYSVAKDRTGELTKENKYYPTYFQDIISTVVSLPDADKQAPALNVTLDESKAPTAKPEQPKEVALRKDDPKDKKEDDPEIPFDI